MPAELVLGNAGYCQAMVGFDVPFDTYVHVCGTDIVRDETGSFLVLEDNARTPSGVAYVVENRHMTLRVLSDVMAGLHVRGVDEYGLQLHNAMAEIAPPGVADPQVVVLSPGIFNSAYFEHVFLAREMGVPLVEGRDLMVEGGGCGCAPPPGSRRCTRSTVGSDDDFLDPDVFNPDSTLGVRGLIEAWRRGTVAIANAVGTGVADDKAIYAYMPRIIRYYLSRRADPAERGDADLRRTGRAGLHAGASGRTGGQAGRRIGRLRPADRTARLASRSWRVPRAAAGRPVQLHQPADVEAVGFPDLVRGRRAAPPCRSAALRGDRQGHLGFAGRTDPGGASGRNPGGELLAGRRLQGHLGIGMIGSPA